MTAFERFPRNTGGPGGSFTLEIVDGAFLEALNPRFAIVSAGPTLYGSLGVMLPDAVVVTELGSRAQVFRTDGNDDACRQHAAKIGPDADGRPGGCDNIRVTITAGGAPTFQIWGGGGTP